MWLNIGYVYNYRFLFDCVLNMWITYAACMVIVGIMTWPFSDNCYKYITKGEGEGGLEPLHSAEQGGMPPLNPWL